MTNQDNNNNNNKRNYSEMNGDKNDINKPPTKRRRTLKNTQSKRAFDNLLLVKASGLNGIYLQLIENIKNTKRYNELENLYKNEEMEIVNLLLQSSNKVEYLNVKFLL